MRVDYILGEALRNMGRNALVVLGAVLAVFISLFLTFGTLLFSEVVRENTAQWADDVRVESFLSDDLALADIEQLRTSITSWEDVAAVDFVSKPQAEERARELFADDPAILQVLDENPGVLPASFRITPTDLSSYDAITARLEASPGVLSVESAGEEVERIMALRDGLQVFSGTLAILLGIAAVALIANTIHMAIYARREEIEIMKLVGASNWFVRVPFLLEGMIEGLLGSLLALAIAIGVYRWGVVQLADLPDFITLEVGSDFLLQSGLLVLAFGVLVGALGSAISLAVHRYIRT